MNQADPSPEQPLEAPAYWPFVSNRVRKWVVAGLLIFGVQVSLVCSANFWFTTSLQERLLGWVLLLAIIPWTARPLARWLQKAGRLSPAVRRVVAVVVLLAATAVLLHSIRQQHRDLALKYHDEFSYMLQARMLASGRLWMPEHPLADFFDSFQVIVRPVYCSMYFPGTALLLVPGVWLNLPHWMMEVFCCAGCVALLYFIVARLINDVAGILAAAMLVESSLFHTFSVLVLSDAPVLMYGLAAMAAWLCWEDAVKAGGTRRRQWVWALVVGAFCGLAAITRPVDALCFALPVGVAMLATLWRNCSTAPSRWAAYTREILSLAVWLILGALPFLALQGYFDVGVTGNVLQTPFDFYAQRDYPQTGFGFHTFDPTLYPKSVVPEKHARPAQHTWHFVRDHTPLNALKIWWHKRIPNLLPDTTADPLILVLIPLGLVSIRGRRWVLGSVPLIFCVLYYFYTFWFPQYAVPLIAPMAMIAVIGAREIPLTYPRIANFATVLLTFGILTICITDLPELHHGRWDGFFSLPELEQMDDAVASIKSGRAVVLFRYAEGRSTENEPVHNETVLWPDDARVIRAQDLGERDIELFRYYARIQPDRVAYLYDRGPMKLIRLGTVAELVTAADAAEKRSATQAATTRPASRL
jgi:branched-subunit amino acid transport protein